MSAREKRLLFFLLVVGFLVLNAAALKMFFLPKLQAARSQEKSLKEDYEEGLKDLEKQGDQAEEREWLAKYEPQPIPSQKAESQLEELANREAQRRGLTVKRRKIQPAVVDEGLSYHRARVELEVSGREQVLYQWIDRLNSPADFRAITQMRLNPKRDDDTEVDCLVLIEQWFVPEQAQ